MIHWFHHEIISLCIMLEITLFILNKLATEILSYLALNHVSTIGRLWDSSLNILNTKSPINLVYVVTLIYRLNVLFMTNDFVANQCYVIPIFNMIHMVSGLIYLLDNVEYPEKDLHWWYLYLVTNGLEFISNVHYLTVFQTNIKFMLIYYLYFIWVVMCLWITWEFYKIIFGVKIMEIVPRTISKKSILKYPLANNMCFCCFEEYNANNPYYYLLRCGHHGHIQCLESWWRTVKTHRCIFPYCYKSDSKTMSTYSEFPRIR